MRKLRKLRYQRFKCCKALLGGVRRGRGRGGVRGGALQLDPGLEAVHPTLAFNA